MGSPGMPLGRTGGELWYPQPHSNKEYIRLHAAKMDVSGFAVMLTGEALTLSAGYEKGEMSLADWVKQ